jgi:thiamine-phosphate pyrophosphorylase
VLQKARECLHVPICAIGGISRESIALVSTYNIAMYSVISAVFEDNAIEKNLAMLQKGL